MLSKLLFLVLLLPQQLVIQKIPLKETDAYAVYSQLVKNGKHTSLVPADIKRITFDPTDNSLIVQGTAEAIKALSENLKTLDTKRQTAIVRIKHVPAHRILEILTSSVKNLKPGHLGLVPEGVTLDVAVDTNSIIVTGPEKGVRDVQLVISQFDVKSVGIEVEVQGAISAINSSFESKSVIANGSKWTYSDDAAGTQLTITPKVNGDGTITLGIVSSVTTKEAWTVHSFAVSPYVRIEQDQACYLWVGGSQTGPQFILLDGSRDSGSFLNGGPLKGLDNTLPDRESGAFELRLVIRAKVKQ